jgi:LPXTG-site transpeptidase (sortase) family protein
VSATDGREKEIRRLLDRGIQALEDGQTYRARALLSKVLQLDTRHEWAWYYLSWTMGTVPGRAWCLERVLDINPRQPHARERLADLSRDLKASADAQILQRVAREADAGPPGGPAALAGAQGVADGPQTIPTSLTAELEEVAASLIEAERTLDGQDLQLRALESEADRRDVLLDELQRGAEALGEEIRGAATVAAQLRSEQDSVLQAQWRLAGELDGLRRGARYAMDQLETVDRRLSEAETRVEQAEQAERKIGLRLGGLKSRADAGDAELDAVRREAEAISTRLQSASELLTEGQERLKSELDRVRSDAEAISARLQSGTESITADQVRLASELDGVRSEAEAISARLQSKTESITADQRRLSGELDSLLVEVLSTGTQLDTVEQRVSRGEARIEHTEGATGALEGRVGSLEDQLAPLSPALQRVRRELGTLDELALETEKTVAGLRKQVDRLQREHVRALRGKPRWAVVPIMALVVGVILISVGALEVFPYMASRLRPDLLIGRAKAVAGIASETPLPSATPTVEAVTPSPSATDTPEVFRPVPAIGPPAIGGLSGTLTPTRAAESIVPEIETREAAASGDADRSPVASPTALPSATPRPPTATTTPTPTAMPTSTPTPTPTPVLPTRLIVPDADVDAAVVPVSWQPEDGTDPWEGTWEIPDGGTVGWHDDSAPLGVPGNTVLSGHNTTGGEVFRYLYQVEAGDVIMVAANDVAFTYVVWETLILPELGQPREVREENARYLLPTEDERLTLVTCHPYGSLRNRLIVIARRL